MQAHAATSGVCVLRIRMLLPACALNVSVVEGQVTLGIQRLRARAFCYETFAHTLGMAYEGHGHRIL